VWAGHDVLAAEAWTWSEPGRAAGSTVTLRLLDANGRVLGERSAALPAVRHPVAALDLDVARDADAAALHPAGGMAALDPVRPPESGLGPASAVVLWEAQWRDAAGRLIDREVSIASTGADFSPLLDLPPASVEAAVAVDGDHWAAHLRQVAGPVAIAPDVRAARPVDAAGWPGAAVDPRPMLPGESRRIPMHWRDDDPGARRLVVDAWNAA